MKYVFYFLVSFLFFIGKILYILISFFSHLIIYPLVLFFYFLWSFKIMFFGEYKKELINIFWEKDYYPQESVYISKEPILRMLYRWITLGPDNFPKKPSGQIDLSYTGKLPWTYFKIKNRK